MPSAYMSHSIRGKKGNDASDADMKRNNDLAMIVGKKIRHTFKSLELYIPAEGEEFVLRAYRRGWLSETQILTIDCEILAKRDMLIAYTSDGYISSGMQTEIKCANLHGIPVIFTDGQDLSTVQTHVIKIGR